MKKILTIALVALFAAELTSLAEMRTWTDKKGNTVEAEFVKLVAGKVVLKTASGKQVKVPQSGLSETDQEYLKNAIPPELSIDVDVDVDRKKSESYSYTSVREKVSGSVTIQKKNREASARKLTATLCLIAKDLDEDEFTVIATKEHTFSFERGNKVTFSGAKGEAQYSKSDSYSGDGKNGKQYYGYLVVIEDDNGNIVITEASRNIFENQASDILKLKKNDTFGKRKT